MPGAQYRQGRSRLFRRRTMPPHRGWEQSRKRCPPGPAAHPAALTMKRSRPPASRSDSPRRGPVPPRTSLTREAGRVFTLSQACWGVLAGKTLRPALPEEGQLSRRPAIPVPGVSHGPADVIGAAMNESRAQGLDRWRKSTSVHLTPGLHDVVTEATSATPRT